MESDKSKLTRYELARALRALAGLIECGATPKTINEALRNAVIVAEEIDHPPQP